WCAPYPARPWPGRCRKASVRRPGHDAVPGAGRLRQFPRRRPAGAHRRRADPDGGVHPHGMPALRPQRRLPFRAVVCLVCHPDLGAHHTRPGLGLAAVGKPVRAGPAMTPYVELADFGSFFAGGRPVRIAGEPTRTVAFTRTASLPYDPNGHYHFEQAYVQYFIPARRRQPLPLVLLHGGGMSGAMWETTPDGRPGWLQHFLALGHAVYVVDNVERGRAGWAPFDSVWPERPIIRSAE